MMKYFSSVTFPLVISLFLLSACRTSGDVAQSKEYVDPTEVKTESDAEAAVPKKEPAHVEELQRQLAILQGENESLKMTHQRELSVMAQKISELEEENRKLKESSRPVVVEEEQPKNVGDLWVLALKQSQKQNYEKSAQNFEKIISNFPKSPYYFHSILGRSMSLYGTGDFKEAALLFNQIIDKFPKKKEVSLAWFGQGCAFYKMGQRQDAKLFFSETIRQFPKTEEALLAKKILDRKSSAPSDLFVAFPGWSKYAPVPE